LKNCSSGVTGAALIKPEHLDYDRVVTGIVHNRRWKTGAVISEQPSQLKAERIQCWLAQAQAEHFTLIGRIIVNVLYQFFQ
jgi:hypothetical protein